MEELPDLDKIIRILIDFRAQAVICSHDIKNLSEYCNLRVGRNETLGQELAQDEDFHNTAALIEINNSHVDMMRGQISNAERSLQAYLQPILSALQRVDIPESINIDIEAIRDTAQSYENQSVNVMRDVLKARSLKNGEVVNSNGVTYSSSSSSSNRNNFNHHSSQEYSNRVDRLRTLDSGPRRFDERDDEEDDCVELVKSDDERHTRHNFEGNQLTKVQGLSLSDDREFDDDVINKSSNTRSHRQKKLSPFIDPSKPDKRRRQSTSSSRKRKDHPSMDDFIVDDEEEIEEYSDDCEDVQSGSDSTYDADNDDINRSSRNIRKEKEKTPTKKKQKTDSHSIAHSARKKVGSRLSPYESYDTHFAENDPPLEEIYEITDDATNITSADMSKREFQRKDGESDERFLIRQKRVEAYRDPSKAVDPPSLNPYERLTTGVSSHSNPHGLFNEVINSNSSSKSILSTVGNIVDGARRCVENAAVIGYSMVSGPKRVEEKQSCSSALNTQNDENTKDILFVNPYFANPNAIIDLCTDKENDEI